MEKAVQIVSIDGVSIKLNQELLGEVIQKIPEDYKVAVVSIVGAFRTGKSFLLDLILRYLQRASHGDIIEDWMLVETSIPPVPYSKEYSEKVSSDGAFTTEAGFGWRSGRDRMTTGIWLWNTPLIIDDPSNESEKLAVLLMDTQGMFDHKTSQMLTACIFGLSTLISSYQMYNVFRQIQEDSLQHLSLFVEYGRMALEGEGKKNETTNTEEPDSHPFQRLDFIVRDWPHFDAHGSLQDKLDYMPTYLSDVLMQHGHEDLQETREHITSCFKDIDCFLLPTPGEKVISSTYDGSIKDISPSFRTLLDIYLNKVVKKNLVAKRVNGRSITGPELFNFICAYVEIFKDATIFPKPQTLLATTAAANNLSSRELGLKIYKTGMDPKVGSIGKFIPKKELLEMHENLKAKSLTLFDKSASMGSKVEILRHRNILISDIENCLETYIALNNGRDPFRTIEMYIIPVSIGAIAYLLRVISDLTCSGWSDVCATSSDFFSHIYIALFFFFVIVLSRHLYAAYGTSTELFKIFTGNNQQNSQEGKKKTD